MDKIKIKTNDKVLPSITSQLCQCLRCGWRGIVLDCENDADGNLICPECLTDVDVMEI